MKTPGIWWQDPVGLKQSRWARFSVDARNHLLTMLTMLGPSPDWCVGKYICTHYIFNGDNNHLSVSVESFVIFNFVVSSCDTNHSTHYRIIIASAHVHLLDRLPIYVVRELVNSVLACLFVSWKLIP